ncbi:MAG: alanine--tRNA ligase [Acidimicrobiaceae bacterium]|nr:alanine--tRNA ligase [Acidimicrobiaceae bacterium]MCY4279706.1 alanine--tRNA ligase [Acidimicrobiaceae bacterium]
MRYLTAAEVREAFVEFFAERGHSRQPSASLIPHDPTLLFTVAGMVPFKGYFTGEQQPPFDRAVTVQKCVRAGGKHNDLDEIGRTSRHLTFFEMLGNFSFGDYFKAEACVWAWEFVTGVLGMDPDRLWVTVHHSDDEAAAIWRDQVGVPAERIQRLGDDNYWRMADVGPCGPCSEIFWDKGPEYGPGGGPAEGGEDRFVEVWNLVFMQFESTPEGVEVPLPKPSIDTGLGLERTVAVLQGVDSVFQTDEFVALLDAAQRLTGARLGESEAGDVSLRILADHARSTAFLVSDGVFPSNEDRGYVLRRILRRAVRHAYLLGVETPVMGGMVDAVAELMGGAYPDLARNHSYVRDVIDREEQRFRQTLLTGQAILDDRLEALGDGQPLDGEAAFLLHDTYGFPLEVTVEIAAERGVAVDVEGFETAMSRQQQRARSARAVAGDDDTGPFAALLSATGPTDFCGRTELTATARVLLARDDRVVLDRTPFYAESGGQIGDTGTIRCEATGAEARVVDTVYALPEMHVHALEAVSGELRAGDEVVACVDAERRAGLRRNHTATHILHWALREVLGDHVKQQGSWVGPDRLRFDFSHYEAMTPDQIEAVEDLANAEVLDNESCRHYETSFDHARQIGAIAFFGDKYGDMVRVLEAGRHSLELCGGTHVRSLGEIGAIHITAEASIGANIRRLEAICGPDTFKAMRGQKALLDDLARSLAVPAAELSDGLAKRQNETKALRAELAELKRRMALSRAPQLAAGAVGGVVVARVDGIDRDGLRDLTMSVRDSDGVQAVVLGTALESGGAALAAAAVEGSGFDAGALIADAKKAISGGGRPAADFCVAGGADAGGLDEALDLARAAAGLSAQV